MTQIEPGKVADIPLGKLRPDPDQPRRTFDEASLNHLADSLKGGVQVPILVRRKGKTLFTIQDGERRYRAAKLAKLKSLPALLLEDEVSEEDIRVAQLSVNEMREELKPMEIARTLAEMQSGFKSMNELQAHLASHGLPGLKPKQVKDLISLTTLPEWAHAMIDAGTLSTKAALKIHKIDALPAFAEPLRARIEAAARWGLISTTDVESELRDLFHQHFPNLGRTDHYYRHPVLFDPEVVCKGCAHLVKAGHESFCSNQEGFEQHQAEAREAGLGPGGVKREQPEQEEREVGSPEAKAEKREEQLKAKATAYLHAYLIGVIERVMRPDPFDEHPADISDELLTWACMGKPGQNLVYGVANTSADVAPHNGAKELGVSSIEMLFAATDLTEHKLEAAVQVLRELRLREVLVICHQLWGRTLDKLWTLDHGYLALLRKAELLEHTECLEPPEGKTWKSLKLVELREAILAHADRFAVPPLLQDIYEDVDEPHVRWNNEP